MEPNNNSSGFVRFGKFETFIARLAGYDLKILADEKLGLDRTEITHEKIKLVRIGISVLIPSFFGFLSSLYYFSTVVEGEKFYKITDSLTIADSWLRLAAAIVIASLLLVIDQQFPVSTLQLSAGSAWASGKSLPEKQTDRAYPCR